MRREMIGRIFAGLGLGERDRGRESQPESAPFHENARSFHRGAAIQGRRKKTSMANGVTNL
jgi:hypothetical protein